MNKSSNEQTGDNIKADQFTSQKSAILGGLIGAGIGGLGGLLSSLPEDPYLPASVKFKRRLKNALVSSLIGGAAGAGIGYGGHKAYETFTKADQQNVSDFDRKVTAIMQSDTPYFTMGGAALGTGVGYTTHLGNMLDKNSYAPKDAKPSKLRTALVPLARALPSTAIYGLFGGAIDVGKSALNNSK